MQVHKQDQSSADVIFKLLQNQYTRRILAMARGIGFEHSIKYEKQGFTKKQWYYGLTGLRRAELVIKQGGRYMQTSFGDAVHDAVVDILVADHAKKRLKAIDILKLSNYSEQEINELLSKKEESQ